MKSKQFELTNAQKKHLDRIYEELGPDLVKKLHKAFTLTAAAFNKRAKQRAEAELQKADQLADQLADQYRTDEPTRP